MTLTVQEVKKIAHLARIELTDAELAGMTEKFASIFNMVEAMQKVDTTDINPTLHPDRHQRLREDAVTVKDQRELFQALAPKVEAGLYLVPQVIE